MPFSALIGNDNAKHTLSHMLENQTLPHALLFSGPEGIGKAAFALKTAECLLGNAHKEQHCDLHQLYPEGKAALHPIENIRNLIKEAAMPPFEAAVKVFIIHDAHKMQATSSNALLKILEEPIAHTYFFLLTDHPESLLPTITSRLRKLSFFPIPDPQIIRYLQDTWKKDPQESQRIALLSHGSFKKAHALALQKEESYRPLIHSLLTLSLPQDYERLLLLLEELEKKIDPDQDHFVQFDRILEEIFAWYRDLYRIQTKASTILYHFDALDALKARAHTSLPPLEKVLSALLTARAALQRHIKPSTILENFFNAICRTS